MPNWLIRLGKIFLTIALLSAFFWAIETCGSVLIDNLKPYLANAVRMRGAS